MFSTMIGENKEFRNAHFRNAHFIWYIYPIGLLDKKQIYFS